MSEYFVRFKATVDWFLWDRTFEGSQIYEAQSAIEAQDMARKHFKDEAHKHGIDPAWENIKFTIIDIRKI